MPQIKNIKKFMAFGPAAVTLLFVVAAVSASRFPDRQKEQGQLVGRTRQALNDLDTLALHVVQAESGQRGYLLSGGREDYLESHVAAAAQIDGDLDRLERRMDDDAGRASALRALRADIAAKLDELKETIDLYRRGDEGRALALVLSDRGRNLMAGINRRVESFKAEEVARLQAHLAAWQVTATRSSLTFVFGAVVVYLSIFALFFALTRESRQRQRLAEAEARAGEARRVEAERLARIVAMQRDIAGHSLDLNDAMQSMIERTQDLTQADGGIVEMMEGDELVYRAASGTAAHCVGLRLDPANSLSGLAIRTDAVLRCDDSETDPRVDLMACRRVGLRSMIVVPLRHKGQPVGVLKVLSARANQFGDRDMRTLELLAGLLSTTLRDAKAADDLRSANLELEAANARLAALASTDGLTGLTNQRTFKAMLDREFERASRHGLPLSLVMLDVDHFKGYNDRFGHPAGDAVLERVGKILRQFGRVTDVVARYGGEEFAVLLPETDSEGAEATADRIRRAIADAGWELREVTASIGVAALDTDVASPASLLKATDEALYRSKQGGRNRVTRHRRPDTDAEPADLLAASVS